MVLLEIACFNLESVKIACEAGADRIELCAGRESGGTTPSSDTIFAACSLCQLHGIPVFVMIRPRGGDFVYSEEEYTEMISAISNYKSVASGFVFGVLELRSDLDYGVDHARTHDLVTAASPLPCTFHRAFDEVTDRVTALDDVSRAGCTFVLTSGGAPDALRGIDTLADLSTRTEGRLSIVAGGGVRSSNVAEIIAKSGVKFVHSSAILDGSEGASAAEVAALKAAMGLEPSISTR